MPFSVYPLQKFRFPFSEKNCIFARLIFAHDFAFE